MNRLVAVAVMVVAARADAGVLVGAELDVHSGEMVVGNSLANATFDLGAAVGIGGVLGYSGRVFSIGFAPHYVPSHRLEADGVAHFSQVDAGVQLGIHNAVTRRVELVGAITPAYSLLYDDNNQESMGGSAGFAITFAAGAVYRVSPRLQLGAQLGYQYGAQHGDNGELAATRLVSLGFVVQAR